MKSKVLIITVFACFSLSCSSIPRSIRNAFTYCYEDRYTGIDKLININGSYSVHSLIFYDNGLVVSPLYRDAEQLRRNDFSFLQEVVENTEAKYSRYHIYNFIDCGSYKICGDTIKIQMIHKSYSMNDTLRGEESWYKIIDRNTLFYLGSFVLTTNQKEIEFQKKYYPFKGGFKVSFVPIPAIPQPDYFWILKEKWFWCNEQDWKNYMEKIKQKKKKK